MPRRRMSSFSFLMALQPKFNHSAIRFKLIVGLRHFSCCFFRRAGLDCESEVEEMFFAASFAGKLCELKVEP
jgi:hypothetical protein